MRNRGIGVCVLALSAMLIWSAVVVSKEQGSLAACQGIKDKVEHYTRLRRSGGSAKSMQGWKRKRDHYRDTYEELRCRRWGSRVK